MRTMIFLAKLNGMEMIAADIGNAYLEAYTNEKKCFIAGREFQDYGHEGHLMLIVNALYGLKTSGTRFHEKFAETMYQLGFMPSKEDSGV
eukprot:12201682-Ditylum_brightwellii.AAC.1